MVISNAEININSLKIRSNSNDNGHYVFDSLVYGEYILKVFAMGYTEKTLVIKVDKAMVIQDIELNISSNIMNPIVVTGTKTFKHKTESAILVNVLSSKSLANVQACNLSEGLKFQPGLRVETDCQTCNYSQLRMNGLAGGYSQILINGRPIFSPLTGLYGLEQLPVNMVERIEVVRGGGSSLYGSSAIGGTVNVITKIPKKNATMFHYGYQSIMNNANDHIISGNSTLVTKSKKSGVSLFIHHRERDYYDHNGDNFSELPQLENSSVGINTFFLPRKNQKIELSLSNVNEFRYGGEMVDKPSYLTQQSEERTHNLWMGSFDYQINSKDQKATLITYAAGQRTKRKHYTGILPSDSLLLQSHIENPPYGNSLTTTIQGGVQLNYKLDNFLKGKNTFTLGTEYLFDDVMDQISSYQYLIDQTTKDLGMFVQSDWDITSKINLLSGVRMDKHNLVEPLIFSPRISMKYNWRKNTQFRLSYGTGFRAPQAFDADMHIAFAGGGVSRVRLSPDLNPEKSKSFTASMNYDKSTEHYIAGFTLEGFHTQLNNVFYLDPVGQDQFGQIFEKKNSQSAAVKGITLELRANIEKKMQLETGFTIQNSGFQNKVSYIDGLEGLREFVRTPNQYGFATITLNPTKKISANINYVYTGEMLIPHFGGADNHDLDEIIQSNSFSELNFKFSYTMSFKDSKSNVELYAGMKNVLNAYQNNFDIGKNRDSNFVYGTSIPRSIFVGLKIRFR